MQPDIATEEVAERKRMDAQDILQEARKRSKEPDFDALENMRMERRHRRILQDWEG